MAAREQLKEVGDDDRERIKRLNNLKQIVQEGSLPSDPSHLEKILFSVLYPE